MTACTLTASQLARKREKDRESQRAARARTKLRMEYLEKELEELRKQNVGNKTVQQLLEQNAALEMELARIRGVILRGKSTSLLFSGMKPSQMPASEQSPPGLLQHRNESTNRPSGNPSPFAPSTRSSHDATIPRHQNSWHPKVPWDQQHPSHMGTSSTSDQTVYSTSTESLLPNHMVQDNSMRASPSMLSRTSWDTGPLEAHKTSYQYTWSAPDTVSSGYAGVSSPHTGTPLEMTGEPGFREYQSNSSEVGTGSHQIESLFPSPIDYQSIESVMETKNGTPGGRVGEGQRDESHNAWRGYFRPV